MLLINNLDSHQCRVVLDPLAEEGLVRSDHPAAGYNLQLLCRDFSKAGHLSVEISLSQRSRYAIFPICTWANKSDPNFESSISTFFSY